MDDITFQKLMLDYRKFVRNFNIPFLGFVSGFMDSELKILNGLAIVKQSD